MALQHIQLKCKTPIPIAIGTRAKRNAREKALPIPG